MSGLGLQDDSQSADGQLQLGLQLIQQSYNRRVEEFKGIFGEIGDIRMTVMAGIALIDELAIANDKIAALQQDVETLSAAGQSVAAASNSPPVTTRATPLARAISSFSSLATSSAGVQSSTRNRRPSAPNSVKRGTAIAPDFITPKRHA